MAEVEAIKLKHPQKRASEILDELFLRDQVASYMKRKRERGEDVTTPLEHPPGIFPDRPQKRISEILDERFLQDQVAYYKKRKQEKAEAEVAELKKRIK